MDLQIYQKIFDSIKSPVIISSPDSLIDCNRALLEMMKTNDIDKLKSYEPLKNLVEEVLNEGIASQYKSISDVQSNNLLLEISLSSLSDDDKIYLIEFKVVDDKSLYEEITFVSTHNRELFNNFPDAIVILDNFGKIVDANNSFSSIFGYTRIEAIGREVDSLIVPDTDKTRAHELFKKVLDHERIEVTVQRLTKDKNILDVHVIAYPVLIDKRTTGNYVIYKDVTKSLRTEKLLHEKEEFLEQLFNRSLFPTAILDENEIILDVNAKFEELFGYNKKEALGKYINNLIVPNEFNEEAEQFKHTILSNHTMMRKTKRRHKDGSWLDVEAVGCPVLIGGNVRGFFAMYRDIRVEEEALNNLKTLLNTDPLTGLYSRKFIYEEINRQLTKENCSFAILYADLDKFKHVNDNFGHETGDHLLIEVANILKNNLGNNSYVSRIGGDEFLAIINEVTLDEAKQKLDTIKTAFSKSIKIDGHNLNILVSIGLAFYPLDGNTADELISASDNSMYEEKRLHQNNDSSELKI